MAKSANQKLKLLSENTDEEHPASTADIIAYLEANDIHSERKSIYDDIEKLRDFGYDILQVHSRRGGGYYMGGRDFELAELKLLVDAVQSSRFITSRKSRSLIKKLELLAGKHDAGKLQRQVYVAGRVKTENESIYYSIDNIHRAIQENRQIAFQYLDQCHLVKGERNVCRFFQRANGQGKWKCQKESRDIFHPVSLRME